MKPNRPNNLRGNKHVVHAIDLHSFYLRHVPMDIKRDVLEEIQLTGPEPICWIWTATD